MFATTTTVRALAVAAAGAALLIVPAAGAATAAPAQYHAGSCQWNNPRARVLCVHRAPADVCKEALGSTAPCWWFTGSDTQVVFNWRGLAVTS
jgi:hypothetical protein